MLIGHLYAIRINYPDTEVRMTPAIELLDDLVNSPSDTKIQASVEELIDLRTYFGDIATKYPETAKIFYEPVELITHLLN